MYWQITLKVPKNLAETVEDFLYTHISQGWQTIEINSEFLFIIYLEEKSQKLEDLKKFLVIYPQIQIESRVLKEENWEEKWKVNFKPLKIGKKIIILPPWEDYNPINQEIIIIIEPGQAFGTGHHPTTQMMLKNIEIFKEKIQTPYETLKVLDLGCGTGILAIACAKIFKNCLIWAVDIDILAIKACKKNAFLNKVIDKIKIQRKIPKEKFHLILVNIGYKEIIALINSIRFLSQKGTHLFLTGFLKEDAQKIIEKYQKIGYRVLKQDIRKEWGFLWMVFQD